MSLRTSYYAEQIRLLMGCDPKRADIKQLIQRNKQYLYEAIEQLSPHLVVYVISSPALINRVEAKKSQKIYKMPTSGAYDEQLMAVGGSKK